MGVSLEYTRDNVLWPPASPGPHPNEAVSLFIVVPPIWPQCFLASDVPNIQLESVWLDTLGGSMDDIGSMRGVHGQRADDAAMQIPVFEMHVAQAETFPCPAPFVQQRLDVEAKRWADSSDVLSIQTLHDGCLARIIKPPIAHYEQYSSRCFLKGVHQRVNLHHEDSDLLFPALQLAYKAEKPHPIKPL